MVLQRDEISKRLPHREAMLLLDSMTIRPDGTVEAVHGFRGEEWFFKGHFPQRPEIPLEQRAPHGVPCAGRE